ncbi:hypothetical protein WPS_22720 [Vulcanimicrobium alpinum]|uniref:Prenyltransferase n=1 Tax=Vulcanimicrobium alpinum TaxID=3016050 RepID=A0AAN1XYI1_UNVUL|nr:prenyltransferase [Vulcanimicrobium alpinum]BDE06996.1 hypothetical protein WPS_22720 [Vulcanimicrobium alpinum]
MAALLAFVRLTRPLFLYGGFAGVALGAAVAAWTGHRLDAATYLWAQAMVTSLHLMVHYANDYFDREGDAHAAQTPWSGGSGVLVAGALPARAALTAALVCGAAGLALALRFAAAGDAVTAVIGVAIAAGAWCYSAPPIRLAARGLGELDTALVVAVLVPCAGYAAFARAIDEPILAAVTPPAFAMFAMMLCVELPDAGADRASGKRTLVVRWGPARACPLIVASASIAAAVAVSVAWQTGSTWHALALLPAFACAIALARCVRRDPHTATMAFWGVALCATVVTGLAAAYAFGALGF